MIDLTRSDDEEESRAPRPNLAARPDAILPPILPSNHGLILPGAFNFSAGGSTSTGNSNGIHSGQNGQTGGRRDSGGGRPQRRPQPNLLNTCIRGPPSHFPQDLNPAKRRKTDGGMIPQDRTGLHNLAALQTFPPRVPSVIVPQPAAAPVSQPTSQRTNSQPQSATSNMGAKKQNSVSGQPLPPAVAAGDRYKYDDRMRKVIENQIFPPIKAAISKYQQSLLSADRERIARRVNTRAPLSIVFQC